MIWLHWICHSVMQGSGTSMQLWVSPIFPITAFSISCLLLLCHEPDLPFRLAFNGQQLIEGFKDNPELSIHILAKIFNLSAKVRIIEYQLTHLCESTYDLDIDLYRLLAVKRSLKNNFT